MNDDDVSFIYSNSEIYGILNRLSCKDHSTNSCLLFIFFDLLIKQEDRVDFMDWKCFAGRNVDDVHNMMDDIAEQQQIATEIIDAISNPVGFGQDVDEVWMAEICINKLLFIWH